jgi:acetyltransferase-like isoleucine patch superfamily enzyme
MNRASRDENMSYINIYSFLKKVPRGILHELEGIIEAIIRNWPGRTGVMIRWLYYKCRLKHLGRGVVIRPGVRLFGHRYISLEDRCIIDYDCLISAGPFSGGGAEKRFIPNEGFTLSPGEIKIGKGVHLSVGCYVLGNGGVEIGDYSCCAGGTRILSVTNHYRSFEQPSRPDVYFTIHAGKDHECYMYGPVVLKRNVGIASNCILLPGTLICEDSFLALCSVAHKGKIGPNSIASGSPAARLRDRYKANKE